MKKKLKLETWAVIAWLILGIIALTFGIIFEFEFTSGLGMGYIILSSVALLSGEKRYI